MEFNINERLTNSTESLEYSLAYITAYSALPPQWVTFSIFLGTAVATICVSSLKPDTKIIMSTNDVLAHATNVINLQVSMFLPVFGSAVLVGLYYLVKNDYINVFVWLSRYMTMTSFTTNISALNYVFGLINKIVGGRLFTNYQISLNSTHLPLGILSEIGFNELEVKKPKNFLNYLKQNKFTVFQPEPVTPKVSIVLNAGSFVAVLISTVVTYGYYSTNSFIYSNIIAMNFMVYALTNIQISSVKTANLLLGLFFVYDIYFVFGTDVMVTVAKAVDLPMKLLVPILDSAGEIKYSLLGLGDIIVPGEYCILCYKLGVDYFIVSMIAYISGLLASSVALHYYNVGQPALLYLVPALLGSTMVYSLIKGEFKRFWNFENELEDYNDEKVYGDSDSQATDEDEDNDYELDSYDEWEFQVEDLRDQLTDIDDDPRDELEEVDIYSFLDDDDDQTFVIDNGDDEDDEVDGADEEEEGEVEDEEEAYRLKKEEIDQLIADSTEKVKYWFDD